MIPKDKIDKAKKILEINQKIKSFGTAFIAKKIDDVEEEIGSLTKIVTDYIESVPFPQDGIDGVQGEKGEKGDRGEQGLHGMKGDKGDKGERGEKGEKGDDGFGQDGKDGKDGVNGKDGSPDTPEEIVVKLNTLEKVLDRKVIKGLETFVDQSNLDRAISILDQRTQFLLSKRTAPDPVATAWGTITGTLSDQTDLQAALDAKGTVTSVAALTLGTTGTDLSSTVATGTTTPVITLNVPTASATNRGALSSADWTTFNAKESALTFSTGLTRTSNTITSNLSTGISGGQSVIGGTASGNNLTLSSTSNATKGKILFGTSAYDEVNNRLGIGISSPVVKLHVLTGTYIAPISDTNYVVQNSGQYVAEYIGTNGGYAGFLVRGTGAGTQPFVQYYNSSTGKIWTQMMTTAGDLNILKGSALGTTLLTLGNNLNVGIANATPTARLHLGAGTATANTAPLKFTTGTNLTTAEAGAMEYNNTPHFTNSDATRRHIALSPSATKTTASAPYTNDGYIIINIGGTDFKVMTTA